MTSKHLFFKAMREDLRHKMWMIALSCLCSFLFFPVAWLMGWSDSGSIGTASRWTLQFFRDYLSGAGGFMAIIGALIVGLSGFRFVFHKNMIDTYHSMPIKRRTLFGVCYLNGFLIWFVPFVLSLLLTMLMAGGVILRTLGSHELTTVLGNVGRCCLMLILLFLLVYHLVLVAVMLSGNILNTLVSLVIMGAGVISIYGLYIAYCELYLSTFYEHNTGSWVVFLSPLVSAVYLLMAWKDNYLSLAGLESFVLENVVVMILLGFAAFWLYGKRASEHAEQGIKNKPASTLMRLAVSIAAGQGGWLIFATVTGYGGYNALGWGIFGSVLFGVLSFGIMNMIFYMDFKAFFAQKLQMVFSVALVLVLSFAIYGDWMDFDHYLPKREEVAELALSANRYKSYSFDGDTLSNMHIQDTDAIYAFLERMAGRGIGSWQANMTDWEYDHFRNNGENIMVRVTLQNGKSYYRYYYMLEEDRDVMWPLFTNEAYLKTSYLIPKEGLIACDYVSIERYNQSLQTQIPLEDAKTLIDAYNQDVLEDPEAILTGQGKLLVSISLGMDYYWQDIQVPMRRYYTLDIYDTMEHSKEALNRMNYGDLTVDFQAEDIEEIVLRYTYMSRVSTASGRPVNSREAAMDVIRDYFGLEPIHSASVEEDNRVIVQQTVDTVTVLNEDGSYTEYSAAIMGPLEVPITEQAEIEELIPLLSYATGHTYSGVLQSGFLQVKVTDKEGNAYNCYLHMGTLPEKYIDKFEPLVEELFED